jgi:succinate dehydrogenase / fumarate reductase, cytochrome b subunit
MNWKHAFTSSIGKKLVMGITGVSLIAFLCVHVYVNALIFLPDNRGYDAYTKAAHFLGSNPLIRAAEIGLFVGIILHIVQGLMLTFQNRAKRPIGYASYAGHKNSTWYSRSMGLLGTLILIFLVLHLYHFWAPNRYQQLMTGHEKDLYYEMELLFKNGLVVLVYVLGCISLAWHLLHGFWSSFQTLGLSTKKYKSVINGIGVAFSIIVPLVFIAMPVAFYFEWLPKAASFPGFGAHEVH